MKQNTKYSRFDYIFGIIDFIPSILLLLIKFIFKIDENSIDDFIRFLTLAHIFFSGFFISNISQSYIFKSPVLLWGDIKSKTIIRILVFLYSIFISLIAFYFWRYSIALISPMEWPNIDDLRLSGLILLFLINLFY